MHLDWERLSMSAYFEALEAHNDMHNPQADKDIHLNADQDRLRALMKARSNG